jgi:hypothetical protein
LVPPESDDLAKCLSHIAALHIPDEPGLFGLNPNADISLQQQQARQLLDDVLLMQPRAAAAAIMALPAAAESQAAKAATADSSRGSSSASNDGMQAAGAAAAAAAYQGVTMGAGIAELLSQVPGPLAKTVVLQVQQPAARQISGRAGNPLAVAGTFGLESLSLVLLQERNR